MREPKSLEMARWSTVLSGVFLALSMILSLGKLLMLAAGTGNNGELSEVDQWLTEIGLKQYRSLFKDQGIFFKQYSIKMNQFFLFSIFLIHLIYYINFCLLLMKFQGNKKKIIF